MFLEDDARGTLRVEITVCLLQRLCINIDFMFGYRLLSPCVAVWESYRYSLAEGTLLVESTFTNTAVEEHGIAFGYLLASDTVSSSGGALVGAYSL